MYQDSLFSVAWGLCPITMIANKNILKEAGIEEFETPIAIKNFMDMCKRISTFYYDRDVYTYGLNILNDETDFLRIYTFLQAFGGGFANDKNEVIFNSRENIAGFTWLREFIRSVKILDTDIYTIRECFARNEVALITDGPWIKYQLEEMTGEPFEKNFKVILNPVYISNESLSWNYNHALAICSQSSNKLYAAKFIDAVTNDHDLSNFYFQQVGHLPANRKYLSDGCYDSEFFNGFKEQLKFSNCINAKNPMFEKAMVLCIDAVRKLLFGDMDIKKELDEKEYYLKMLYYG
jgi:ABC-type glycerol-3-phosphate transport system substrate-binding protein